MYRPARSRRLPWLRWLLPAWCALALAVPALALAQASPLTAADRADIQAFTITADVLARLKAVVAQARDVHIKRAQPDMANVHSLDDMARQLVATDPRIKPLLAKHGFTPRQLLVANLALVSTVVTMEQVAGTPQEKAVESHLNPANVRFYKQHKAAMEALVHPPAASQPSH